MSIATKKYFENIDNRKKQSDMVKKLWEDKGYRQNQLDRLNDRYKNPDYCEKLKLSLEKYYENIDNRKKQSDVTKKYFENKDNRKKQSDMVKRYFENIDNRKEQSNRIKNYFKNTDSHIKLSMSIKKLWENDYYKIRIIEFNLGGFWYGNVRYYNDDKYCEKFNNNFKERVRSFWNYKCFICDKPQSNRKLHVHHVHYDKKMCCNGSPQDCVPLCDTCHGKTCHNRDYWEDYLTYKLYSINPDGKCFYKKNETIKTTI